MNYIKIHKRRWVVLIFCFRPCWILVFWLQWRTNDFWNVFFKFSSFANILDCNRWNIFSQVLALNIMPEGGSIIITIILHNCGHIFTKTKTMFLQKISRWKLKAQIYWYDYICRYLVFLSTKYSDSCQIFPVFVSVHIIKDDYFYYMPIKFSYFDKKMFIFTDILCAFYTDLVN